MKSFAQYITEAKEYILWGLPKGKKDPLYQEILSTQSKTPAQVEEVKRRAAREGWHSFRVQILDMSEPFEWNAKKMVKEAKVNYWDNHIPKPKWSASPWKRILGVIQGGAREVPLTSKLINKIWEKPINATVFHVTNVPGAVHVVRNQKKKSVSLSVMPHPPSTSLAENGVWVGGVVVKLQANILMGGQGDIMSTPDDSGRRWVNFSVIADLLPIEYRREFRTAMMDVTRDSSRSLAKMLIPIIKDMDASNVYVAGALKDILYFLDELLDGEPNAARWGHILTNPNFPDFKPNKQLGIFVKDHIDRATVVLEKYLGYTRDAMQELADQTYDRATTTSYSELVANNFKVLGVAWYATDPWGVELEKLQGAIGNIPFYNFGNEDKSTGRWIIKTTAQIKKTPEYAEFIKK